MVIERPVGSTQLEIPVAGDFDGDQAEDDMAFMTAQWAWSWELWGFAWTWGLFLETQ